MLAKEPLGWSRNADRPVGGVPLVALKPPRIDRVVEEAGDSEIEGVPLVPLMLTESCRTMTLRGGFVAAGGDATHGLEALLDVLREVCEPLVTGVDMVVKTLPGTYSLQKRGSEWRLETDEKRRPSKLTSLLHHRSRTKLYT